MCQRFYVYHTPDYGMKGPGCSANKLAEAEYNGPLCKAWHLDPAEGSGNERLTTDLGGTHNASKTRSEIVINDCLGQVCRVETCAGAASRDDLRKGRNVTIESEVRVINGPDRQKIMSWGPRNEGSCSSTGNGWEMIGINGFREGNCTGKRYFFYYLEMEWERNEGQRIGKAWEVEGCIKGVDGC